ncbi:hypothetical protein FPQ18DRAFT_383745 [Pyronema domesticum]|uniref:Similar to Actin-related protein 2 acc. no. P32381 n=1 Tax=Pyronema omphalodes (strain CBS 100304) TaxID=1076935 RepID=U4LVY0_PYROM|nr:hypothetical protein FPQ18DRAFT_383745 [Pyronema domesticum]CCX32926.1 Similar to Actin-related protein 2; acc. no. P32381 [Pyronema omphalodes CBS 100304]
MDPKTPTTYRGLPPSLRTPSFGLPTSPHRYTPSSSLHNHEEPLIFEIGSRILRAGFTNEPAPRCTLAWSETLWRRVGDRFTSASEEAEAKKWGRKGGRAVWDTGFALRGGEDDIDGEREGRVRQMMGLVEDLVERGIRVAYNKHLIIDSKQRRILLPVPPLFPTRLLTTLLATIFTHFQAPSITLLSSPVLAVVASGLRSGLVIDIGFHETIVTPVYELRAVEGRGLGVHGRSRRSISVLREAWIKFLLPYLPDVTSLDFDEVEEIMERLGHISSASEHSYDPDISIPVAGRTIKVPFSRLAEPAEKTFFAATTTQSDTPEYGDDDDTPLPRLLYNALIRCPVDVRATAVSRIMFVGGGARIPGLQARVLRELEGIVEERGWQLGGRRRVRRGSVATRKGSVVAERKGSVVSVKKELEVREAAPGREEEEGEEKLEEVLEDVKEGSEGSEEAEDSGEAEDMPVEETAREMVRSVSARSEATHEGDDSASRSGKKEGEVRGVRTLGVWAGGSLVAGLKVRGKVEIEKDKFLSQVANGGTGLPAGW